MEKQSNYHTIKNFYEENPCIVIVDYFLLKKLVPESFTNFTVTCYVRKQKKNSKRINKEKHKGNKIIKIYSISGRRHKSNKKDGILMVDEKKTGIIEKETYR
ncbi:hypothetical protein [Peribacillus simplex]|uniref:hypothetical protein n=1 Tax=Peribacillus simplex TaxID=1478 RepID=UPI0011DE15A0|nr:hypothetical protein [Peribacillus simplex]